MSMRERPELVSVIEKFRVELPEVLPITRHAAEIAGAWKNHQVIIVAGDTGSGKTTQLPKIALQAGFGRSGRIGCTQPRRLAAVAMARRAAAELNCELGEGVGYQVRFDDRTTSQTALKFMTDGILLAETRNDRLLRQYQTIIIDEAHERSLNIDFLLGYLKNLLPRRPDLKVAISSATLDTENFVRFFDDAPLISIEGRTFPVEDVYMPPEDFDEDLPSHIGRAVEYVCTVDARGDILVFLPGEREIREAADLLSGRNYRNTEVLPLFGRLAVSDQQKVFNPGAMRRIILATNVAETSVTIPRIRFVIDSGQARIKRYNPRSQVEELQIETISQASARQRRGRCGRIAEGVCVHLYSEDDLSRAAAYTDPEIKRTGLAGVILQMASLGLPRIDRFPFINPPPSAAVREGLRTLEDLRALEFDGKLTNEGWKLASLPIDPQLGKMLLTAERKRVLPEALVVAAFLSILDPAERPQEKQQSADEAHRRFRDGESDFLSIINLWNAVVTECTSNRLLRNFCKKNYYNFNRLREWRNLVDDLIDSGKALKWNIKETPGVLENIPYDQLHISLLSGIPRHIAHYLPEEQYFHGTAGKKFQIFPGSGLHKKKPVPQWLMSFAIVETSRLFARQNARIKPEFAELAAPHLCTKVYDQPYWDKESGFVYARERLTFGGLLIHNGRRVHYANSHPKEAREIFIREGLATGEFSLAGTWLEKSANVLHDLRKLEEKVRRPGTILDTEAAVEHYLTLLPEKVHSVKALKELLRHDKQDYSFREEDLMQEQFVEWSREDYPDHLEFSGQKFPLRYQFMPGEEGDGITMFVPSDQLNVLPPWALDYLVPGYITEKVELCLRALPKYIRQRLNPIAGFAESFLEALDDGKVFGEQPLFAALAEYVRQETGEPVAPTDFESVRLPEYLKMKLAELSDKRRVKEIHYSVPESRNTGSRLSKAVAGVQSFEQSGSKVWPGLKPLPLQVQLPNGGGKLAYPALCDEGECVGSGLYLKENEAKMHHRQGVIRLFRLEYSDQVKFLKRSIRLERNMELSWFLNYRDYADDLLDAAILDAFGDPWELRDEVSYGIAAEGARQELGCILDDKLKTLAALYKTDAVITGLFPKVKAASKISYADVKAQHDFLFRPRFLKSEMVFSNYSRYLRGLKLRVERLTASPGKDELKLEQLEDFIERFALTVDGVEISSKPSLEEFWELLEEGRLSVFAPEVPLGIRTPLKKLPDAWQELRF